MGCFSTNKTIYCSLIPRLILFLCLLQGCIGKDTSGSQKTEDRRFHTVNLFSEKQLVYDNTGKLSFDEAFAKSRQVIRTASLKQIDYSDARGVKPFYIYQVDEGSFQKQGDTHKIKFPILFISGEELFKGKVLQDSVYLFLAPLQQYRILQKNAGIQYEWIDDAPFLKQGN